MVGKRVRRRPVRRQRPGRTGDIASGFSTCPLRGYRSPSPHDPERRESNAPVTITRRNKKRTRDSPRVRQKVPMTLLISSLSRPRLDSVTGRILSATKSPCAFSLPRWENRPAFRAKRRDDTGDRSDDHDWFSFPENREPCGKTKSTISTPDIFPSGKKMSSPFQNIQRHPLLPAPNRNAANIPPRQQIQH